MPSLLNSIVSPGFMPLMYTPVSTMNVLSISSEAITQLPMIEEDDWSPELVDVSVGVGTGNAVAVGKECWDNWVPAPANHDTELVKRSALDGNSFTMLLLAKSASE